MRITSLAEGAIVNVRHYNVFGTSSELMIVDLSKDVIVVFLFCIKLDELVELNEFN